MALYCTTLKSALALGMAAAVPISTGVAAEQHIVQPSELHAKLATATEAREKNLAQLDRFFASEPARKAMQTARMDARQVRQAVALLSSAELERLADRARKAETDIAAGAMSNQELTYIVIALATAVVILVIVAAR